MKFLHFIPFVNRIDLTVLAINSCKNLGDNTILIDNSPDSILGPALKKQIDFDFTILIPSVPLTTAQTYNLIRKIGIEEKTDFITFMHNDCEILSTNGDSELVEESKKIFSDPESNIGWIHHSSKENEDLFCSYKTEMLIDVGEWDWLCFPFYYLDIDFIKRVRSKGWTVQPTASVICKHHNNASNTIKSDKLRAMINPYYFGMSETFMNIKWNQYSGNWPN